MLFQRANGDRSRGKDLAPGTLGSASGLSRCRSLSRPVMFSRNELDELVASESRPALSIYMPTHAAGREIRQDPICLRNLLFSAKGRLGALCRPAEIDKLLAPAWRLLEDETFWRHQQEGLAIFLAPAFDCVHRL